MCLVDQGLGGFALDTRQGETRSEEVAAVREVQVHFGVDGNVGRQTRFFLRAASAIGLSKQADQGDGEQLLRVGTDARGARSRKLDVQMATEVREAPPSRPPVLWVLAVYSTLSRWVMVCVPPWQSGSAVGAAF